MHLVVWPVPDDPLCACLQMGTLGLRTGTSLFWGPTETGHQDNGPLPGVPLHLCSPLLWLFSPWAYSVPQDQGKLCLGIVFPKKFTPQCQGMTQRPESPGGPGEEAAEEGKERRHKGGGPLSCTLTAKASKSALPPSSL